MARKKKPVPLNYASTFDAAMKAEFNEDFDTSWNFFIGTFGAYETTRANGRKLTKAMALFGRGVSAGLCAAIQHFEDQT
jgi:hypothetical protein